MPPRAAVLPKQDGFRASQLASAVAQQQRSLPPWAGATPLTNIAVPSAAIFTIVHGLKAIPQGYILTRVMGDENNITFISWDATSLRLKNNIAAELVIDILIW